MSDENVLQYSMKYSSGYGLTVPDGHIIRIQRQILDYELHLQGGDLLDFGCGNGTHAKWLREAGIITKLDDLFYPDVNIRAAVHLYRMVGWSAWSATYG